MASNDESDNIVFNYSSASLGRKENSEAHELSESKTISFDSIKKGLTKSLIKITRRHGRKSCKRKRIGDAPGLMIPMRGGEVFRKRCRKLDVRYAKEITKFISKYSNFHSSRKCPLLTERLTRHRVVCHSQRPVDASNHLQEGTNIALTESQTRLHSAKCKTPALDIGSQTEITLSGNIHVPLKKCATRVIEPKRNIYKEHLNKEIIDWFQNIPIFYSLDFTLKYLKDNIAVTLLENINNLATQKCKETYEGLVQKQIEDCLNILPMWLPNMKQDQRLFKNSLKEKLYQNIKELNAVFLNNDWNNENIVKNEVLNNIDESKYESNDDNAYVKVVSDWLENLKFSTPISTKFIKGYIMKSISSTLKLNDPVRTRCYKSKLQEKIKDILDQLPIEIDYDEYRGLYMYQFSEDLVNRLLNIKTKVDIDTIYPEMYKKLESHKTKSPPYSNELKQPILEKIDQILRETNANGKGLEMEIYATVINSLKAPRFNVSDEIYHILCKRLITYNTAMTIAKKIETAIQLALKHNDTNEVNNKLFGIMSVYRSNAENFVTSTPIKQEVTTDLHPSENLYVERVASIVKAWMETFPNTYNIDKDHKNIIIYDFAEEIINEKKREQSTLQSDIVKDKYFAEFVNKSFAKFNIFDDPNDATPYMTVLLEKLKFMPVPNLIAWNDNSRQAIDNLSDINEESGTNEQIIVKSTDVLKDQILVWVNQQPAEIYVDNNNNQHVEMINKLALTLQDRVNNNMSKDVIDNDIKHWLNEIIRPENKDQIDMLALCLKKNLTDLPLNLNNRKNKSPELDIVEFIEEWCEQLPVDTEANVKIAMKANVAKRLYQKVGQLSINPIVFNDENLFKDLLEDEVDTIFENLPQNPDLRRKTANLKGEFINTILDLKKAIEQKFAGSNYKHKLETTLNASLPNPVQMQEFLEPGFEIYKNYVAKMFILDNFDHSNEDVKSKYERRIKYEIDKYFDDTQKNKPLLISKEQMYNELYSVLFKVPMPNEQSMIDEVEEVKTRCEIDAWFESLPLEAIDDVVELLKWDQMLSTLTKRIHNIEKNEPNPDQKLHIEINKFLQKLPLLPEKKSPNNIEQYINVLLSNLKSSAETRKYVAVDRVSRKGKNILKNKNNCCDQNISQVPGPSANNIKTPSEQTTIRDNLTPKTYKSPADQIEAIVENWCNKLPWIGEPTQYERIKNETSTKVIIKIYELNTNTDIFNDDVVYDQLLDEELESIITSIHSYCDFGQTKLASKYQLKEMIKSIKPLIKEEKYRYEYKAQLNELVDNLLNDATNIVEYHKLKDDIVNNFIQYTLNKNDDDKQIYKRNMHDAVTRYNLNINDEGEKLSSLVKLNQLVCELSKVPVPTEAAMKEEVEEIKMRIEVEQLFKENNLNDCRDKTEQMKKTLTKTLNEIEKLGHTELNDSKMNADITKCLNKLGKKVSPHVIQNFVDSLKDNEMKRKVSQFKSDFEMKPVNLTTDNNRDEFTDQHIPLRTVPYHVAEHHSDDFMTETKPQLPYFEIPIIGNQYEQNRNTSRENEVPMFNQDIRYNEPSNFQIHRPGFESLQPPTDYVQYLPPTHEEIPEKEHSLYTVCRNCSQCTDTQNQGIGVNPKQNLNEPWNIYKPEVTKQRRGSFIYEDLDGKSVIKSPVSSREHKTSESCRQSLHRPTQLSRQVSNNPRNCSPEVFEQVVPTNLKRGSKPRHLESYDIERHRCTCVLKNKCKRKRYCMIPVDEYCEECGGYRPRWCRVLMPICPYINC